MNLDRQALDRHITGNWGEDQFTHLYSDPEQENKMDSSADFVEALKIALAEAAESAPESPLGDTIHWMGTFAEAGVLSGNDGLVVVVDDPATGARAEFQVTVVRSR